MQLYGNKLWNDVTDNQHKAYFVMQEDAFRAVTERLDSEGLNYYAFEQNGIYKMAVNDHDLRYFREVIGDRLLLQMDRTTTTRSNTPQTVIGPTEYRSIQNKRYFTSDIDMVLKIAEHLQHQNVPFSGRVYDDHATITVSAEHEVAVLDINNRVLTERQQHRHTVSQHLIVGSVPYQDIQQPFHFASRMKPQEFMQVRPILDAAGIPYSGIVKNGGIILTVNKQDVQQFGILLNAAQTKRHSIDELQEAGFSDHQIALMDTALDRFAEANDYDSIIDFVDPRFSDEQILYMADAAARYIVQSEADRIFDRSGILLDMIHYRDAAIHQLEFDEAFQDTAFSPEQLSVLRGMYDNGMTVSTMRSSLDESYTVEELQRIGTCFRDSDIDGLRKIQEQHNSELALAAFDPEPDDLAQTVYMHETEEEMQRDIPAGAWQEIVASEEIAEEPAVAGDTFQIYRLRDDANDLRIRFEGYDTLQQLGFVISADKYESIYTGALEGKNATLNGIYETFNINHPADFNGYSLSVGDIIVLNQNDERSAHMVDSIGFMELPDFFLERQEPEQDAGERQPDLFDLPYSARDKQVFGNTPFKYISGKTYHKMDTETARQIAQELAAQEIKFSGRIKGNSTTLTVPAASEEQYQAIAAQFIPEEPAIEESAAAEPVQPLELHIGDHIRLADDAQNAWIVTEVSDFILKLENADQKAIASAQMMTGWQKHLNSSNVTILPEKGLPAPPPPKKRSAHIRKQAEGQLALFGEPEEVKPDRRQELLIDEVGRGSGFVNGKLRIYDFIHDKQHSNSELADFLKEEYGIGGHAGPDMPDVSHDSKGLFITDVDKREYQYSWSEVARTITELDKKEEYLTSQDIEDALDHARYYLNEVEYLDDRERTYYEGILAKWEHHPLLADLPGQPEITEPAVEEPAVQEEAQATAEPVEIARSADGLLRFTLCEQREPAETPWNVQRWTRNSTDEDFRYNGFGRFTETEQEARDFITRQYERYEDNNCVDAITEAINRNYIDNHFDSAKALKEVQEHYPIERIALLLAAEVQNADWDGRYSGSVRDWSRKEMKQHGAAETEIALQRRQFPHPCLTNMLAEAVMEYQAAQAIEETEIAEEPEQTVQAPTAEQPVKIRNTMEHRIFLRMRNLYPEVMQDSPTAHNYEHYESPNPGTGYEPFAIQRLTDWNNGQCLVSMMHTYEQNGDLMRDPDIVLRVDLTQQTATAISYQQDGLGIYREYPDGSYGQRDTNRFMLTWLKKLNDQHRELTQAEVEYMHDGTIYNIDLNYENGQLREVVCDGHPEVERAFAKEIGQKLDEIDAAAEAARTETPAERAKRLINAYTQGEFGQDADYSDMSHVDLAYVSDKETGMPIEVYADLEAYRIIRTLGGAIISEQQYDSLDDMCENALEYLDFNSMTDIDDSEREKAQQPNRLELSPAARFLMNEENMQSFVDRLIGGDKMNEIASRILDNGENAANVAQEYIGDGRIIFSDHETFDDTAYAVSKTAEDVTFTAEPDSKHPFSVTYSWEQVGSFMQRAAQLVKDVDREAAEEWEREVAENIEEPAVEAAELDPEAKAARAQEIEKTIQTLQRRIENYNPETNSPERLQEWTDTLDYLQSDTPDNIEITSEGMQVFLENRDQQNRTEKQTDFTIGEDFSVPSGKKGKYQVNIAAIRTLKAIEAEDRAATPDEQKILAGYVGWGGVQEAFDSDKEDWTKEYTELRSILIDDEYAAARASTENAHYTQPMIISEMYQALERFGFTGGRVLEPSMGIGNFFGTMPETMRSSSELYGVELDSISGRIAKQLYPSADIEVTGFERTHFNDDAFDVVVGNVPFGNHRVMDSAYDEQKFKIHDYFLAKGMDKLKAGGIMAVVTSSGSMDKQDDSARKYLAERAELVGAVRLPNNAFKANAGADVTTDILFFQKRQEPLAADTPYPEWTQLSVTENGLRINSYFKEHPEMVLGTLEKSTNPYSSGVECVPLANADLRQQLSEALGKLSAEINHEPVDMDVRDEQFTDDAPLKTYFMRDGNLYFKDSADKPAEVSDLTGKKRDRVIGMIGIRDAARAVIQAQTENCTDEKLNELQAVLTERYDAFYKKNGLIHSKANATVFREDDGFALICSLEKDFDLKQGTLGAKADIFTKRTINQFSEVDHAESSEDALIVSMQYRGKIDFPYMEQLCGKSKQEMIADLGDKIFPVPDLVHPERVTYQTADEYLSGNILVKLEQAKAAAQQNPLFEKNIPALEAVMPPKLRAGDIKVRLGATWIKPEYIRQFMYETLDTPKYYQVSKHGGFMQDRKSKIDVEFVPEAGLWHVSNAKNDKSIKSTRDFGTKAMTAYEILDDVLNLRSPKIYMSVPDPGSERGEKRVLDGEATSLAQKKAASLQQAFENWIFKDPKRAADLVETYNALFNSTRPREYDGSHMIFPGMASDITLRPHQKNAIAHALYGGNALFAHCVGAGKTYEMIATAMEGKRLGMHHKSLFVVPKHLTAQIGEDFLRLYPSANILVATTKDFKAENRRELMARIATGNYDAVIISHDQFKRLPLSADRATRQIQIEVDTLTESINKARSESGGKSFTVKALERTRQALITQMEQIVAAAKRDEQNVTFEQLGIDHIFVDEAHEFKNLFCPTKLQNLSGISTSSSQKAMDLYIKCRYLDEETGSRGVTLATGTPISNSITEIHTMLRYLAHDTLEQHGLAAFDAFISTFGAPKTDWELSPTGNTWRQKTRMAGFDNMPELQSLWRAAADVQTAETLNLPTPDCEMHIVEAKPTQLQQEMMQELSDRADAIQAGSVDIHEDNNLLITSDGRKVGLDPRLVDPTLEDNPNTKLNQCVDNVFRIWNETSEQRSTQLIFCDLGVPHKTAKAPNKQENEVDSDDVSVAEMFSLEEELPFCVYDDIKEKLVSRGVPAEEIAFIHEAKTEAQKSALFEKVRNGDVRVLIGSTPKMGTGTNVQDKLIALHDLDIPWRPADLEQRRGRMVRQGNENDKVHLYRYVTTGTFDAVSYQTLEAKQKFIGQVMTSQPVGRSCEDIDQSALSYAQIKAACTGDGRFKEKMQLETEVQALQIQRTEHLNTQDEMREKVAKLPHKIFMAEGNLSLIQLDYNQVAALPRDENGLQFSIDINGETITDKTEAAKRVSAYFSAAGKNPGQDIMVGNFCGFPLSITCQMNHIFATLHGQTTHTAELSISTNYIVRGLQDLVNGIGRKLQKQTREIAEMKVDLQQAKDRADQPFPQETELTQKSERLASLSDALRKEAMAKMLGGEKQGRQTFYFDRNRRNELRNAAKQAGQKPQEKQNNKEKGVFQYGKDTQTIN